MSADADQPACSGLNVLEVAHGFCAATLCGQLFAGLGAEVVKVEQGAGDALRTAAPVAPDGNSYAFHLTNAGKKSALLGADPAADWAHLVRWADIIVFDSQCLIAGVALDPGSMAAQYPTKIICVISPFGLAGKRASWRGGELPVEAMGGLMACTGYPELPPVMSGVPYAEHVTAMFAFGGIMSAVLERSRSGLGQLVEVASTDCLVALLGNFIPSFFLSGRAPKRIGNRHTIAAPWNLYPAADGGVVICTGTGGSTWWRTITTAMARPDLSDDPRYDSEPKRVERVEEVDAVVSEWTAKRSTREIVAIMTDHGVPASEVATIADVIADRQNVVTRAMVNTIRDGGNDIWIPGLPLKVGAWRPPAAGGPCLKSFQPVASRPEHRRKSATPKSSGALAGLRVLEFASRTSVPMAGRLLSDLGADVVKIEPAKGESLRGAGQQIGGASYLFQINNGGKRSVVIEPGTDSGRRLILELAAKSDVWMENLAPGTLQKMGLGYDDLRKANPRIIYCSVSGFGLKSEHGRKKALDTVVQAASGIMSVTGYPGHMPVKLGISAVDLSAAVGLIGAITSAVYARERTGMGQHVDVAMADLGVWMTQSSWLAVFLGEQVPPRRGNRSATLCPHNLFATADGFLALAVEDDGQWLRLAKLIGSRKLLTADFATTPQRLAKIDEVESAVSDWLKLHPSAQTAERLQSHGICAAPLRTVADIVADPETSAREMVVKLPHPTAGEIRLLGTPLKLSRTPARLRGVAPMLGEHTIDVLTEWLNMTPADIAKLAGDGIVVSRSASIRPAATAAPAAAGA